MTTEYSWQRDGWLLRSARAEDAEAYWRDLEPLDEEAARLTGSSTQFEREAVTAWVRRCAADPDRFDFLLIAPDGHIAGESVINELDRAAMSANYRIAIFRAADRGRGLGSWMVRAAQDFAFGVLGLHRLSLDVFSFNERALRAYRAAGFRQEGVLRDAVRDGDSYADDILMAMLEDEWRALGGEGKR